MTRLGIPALLSFRKSHPIRIREGATGEEEPLATVVDLTSASTRFVMGQEGSRIETEYSKILEPPSLPE